MNAADHYVRFHYENDYFGSSDEYYTQGMNLEFVAPVLENNPLAKLLIVSKENTNRYGIAIEHNAYTPTSISSNEILYGDRPFAASLLIKTFGVSNNITKHYRVSSAFSLGMIGKVAGAYQIQKTIHRWINDTDPQGWQYQIKNDLIINYELGLENNLIHSNYFVMNSYSGVRLGTLNTKLSAGATLLIGRLNSTITSIFSVSETAPKQKFTFHFYAQPIINAVLHDATMQGGLIFNRDSPYTLSSREIEHFTVQANAGVVFSIGAFYVAYFRSIISKEFKAGHSHQSGGLSIGILW